MKKTIKKTNETKSRFFEKINKIDKPLASLIKKKREQAHIDKIRKEKGEVTMNTTKYEGPQETITGNYMSVKWTTWKKWTNS